MPRMSFCKGMYRKSDPGAMGPVLRPLGHCFPQIREAMSGYGLTRHTMGLGAAIKPRDLQFLRLFKPYPRVVS